DLRHTRMFITGNNDRLMQELADQMDAAAREQAYEKAAVYRDQIMALRSIQAQQVVEEGSSNIDVVAAVLQANTICVHVLFIRQGRILGSRSFFPQSFLVENEADVLAQFIAQFYLTNTGRENPPAIITSHPLEEAELLAGALQQSLGRQVYLTSKVRGHRAQWLQMAATAAQQNLIAHLNSRKNARDRLLALQDALGLDEPAQRLECFDISRSSGELTLAS